MRRAICWIRRDLRLHDHAALAAATREADEVIIAFCFDTSILDRLADRDDRRVTFIHRSLRELDSKVRALGSAMLVLYGDPAKEIPRVARELGAEAVFANRDYEPYARERDGRVASLLDLRTFKDMVALEPGEVLAGSGEPFRVFTPFRNAWRRRLDIRRDLSEHVPDLGRLASSSVVDRVSRSWELAELGFRPGELWLEPGEAAGRQRLGEFMSRIGGYADARNFPAREGTSGLSVHFRLGTASVREAYRRAFETGGPGAEKWIDELIWREFYQHVLWHFPQVVERPFQERYASLECPGSDEWFAAWCLGMTGYPIVDAAMRHLNRTGWMHNRLRMVCASFLTKDLLVDYRRGEAYFARMLLDFELASNNGGWQWSASVGADAQPYFRVFNPVLQGERFDPAGDFIRANLPELAGLSGRALHAPWTASAFDLASAGIDLGRTYPLPIVDHGAQRARAIALLSSAAR